MMRMNWGEMSNDEWLDYHFLNKTSNMPNSVHRINLWMKS
jgi:hypothetical protein